MLFNSRSALGANLRRQRARVGAPKAISVTAHELARLIYAMVTQGTAYVVVGQEYYELRDRVRVIHNSKRRTQEMRFELGAVQKPTTQ